MVNSITAYSAAPADQPVFSIFVVFYIIYMIYHISNLFIWRTDAAAFVLPDLGDREVAELMLQQPSLSVFVTEMKACIGFQLFEHNRGAPRHGKSIVDAIGHLFNSTVQKGNVAPLEALQGSAERAMNASTAVAMLRGGGIYSAGSTTGGLRGLTAPVPSERARIKSSGQKYVLLPTELLDAIGAIAPAPCEVKTLSGSAPSSGEGSSRWFAIQHRAGLHMRPWSRKLSCCCIECSRPDRVEQPSSDCAFYARLGEWQQWQLNQLTRPEEALAIRSFSDELMESCTSKPRIVALHVPQGYDDTAEYWLMQVTSVEAVGNHQGVLDSVEQKVKKGDAMLFGHFLERLPWYRNQDRQRLYYAARDQVRMDARHCMRDVGTIEDNVTSGKMSARQLRTLGETLDGKRYSINVVAHDTIMDHLEPGVVPL
eukprot:SAG31_NODE_151_length_22216_cov_37.572139_14_plen_426_part_00